jgi:hypothetical protein
MTKLLINKLKQDLNAEPSAASEQGKQIKKKFNILDAQLGPNLESMANFFGNVSGIDKFDLDNLNPFKKEGFIGQEGHGVGNEHFIQKSVDGKIVINPAPADDGSDASEEYKLYKKLNFQKIHTNSQKSWLILWGGILLVLIIIKLYFFISTFLFGKGEGQAKPAQAKPAQAKPAQAGQAAGQAGSSESSSESSDSSPPSTPSTP